MIKDEDWVLKLNLRLSFYHRIMVVKNAWENPWVNVANGEGNGQNEIQTLNKGCAKLVLDASRTYDQIADSDWASEQNSMVVGLSLTQANILLLL